MTPTDAHRALKAAEARLEAAAAAREEAADALDAALAERGWLRLAGSFSAGALPLYSARLHPGSVLHADEVVDLLAERTAAA